MISAQNRQKPFLIPSSKCRQYLLCSISNEIFDSSRWDSRVSNTFKIRRNAKIIAIVPFSEHLSLRYKAECHNSCQTATFYYISWIRWKKQLKSQTISHIPTAWEKWQAFKWAAKDSLPLKPTDQPLCDATVNPSFLHQVEPLKSAIPQAGGSLVKQALPLDRVLSWADSVRSQQREDQLPKPLRALLHESSSESSYSSFKLPLSRPKGECNGITWALIFVAGKRIFREICVSRFIWW